jgi:hypothetical protein
MLQAVRCLQMVKRSSETYCRALKFHFQIMIWLDQRNKEPCCSRCFC